jgi:hypothetical protein
MKPLVELLTKMISDKPLDRPSTKEILDELTRIKNIKYVPIPQKPLINKYELSKTIDSIYYAKYNESMPEFNGITEESIDVTITKYEISSNQLAQQATYKIKAPSSALFYNYIFENKCRLFVIGGAVKYGEATTQVSELDYKSPLALIKLHPMKNARIDFGITSFRNFLFMAGGRKSHLSEIDLIDSVEMYDTLYPANSKVVSMQQAKYGCAVCIYSTGADAPRLYVIGGKLLPQTEVDVDSKTQGEACDFSTLIEVFNANDLTQIAIIDAKQMESSKEFLSCNECIAAQVDINKILIFGQYSLRKDTMNDEPEQMRSTTLVPYYLEIMSLNKARYVKCKCEESDGFETYNCIELSSKLLILPKFQEYVENPVVLCLIYNKEEAGDEKFITMF